MLMMRLRNGPRGESVKVGERGRERTVEKGECGEDLAQVTRYDRLRQAAGLLADVRERARAALLHKNVHILMVLEAALERHHVPARNPYVKRRRAHGG